ncbi:MFS transporter [Candidatus Berkiella aquae]|uniref:Inner membrane transport protein YdhC n=1 Tax=Candidatus Berkiella aquae TaxID=295108 RepID=A0A0Q9YPR6_9GAMM|nr:MFS transporter [Candidatus Berkiella aquae]MCS5711934.1 MFS transporter [Candidatus Berkiella aquae]
MKQPSSKVMLLATVILMDLLVGIEFDLFVPSFLEIQNQFHLSAFWVEASLSINFLGYCVSLFWVGALADRFGRKPIILLGLLIFCLGSVFCLWAPLYAVFLLGRFLQGIGIAAPTILSFLIIADTYPLKQQQFYIAMLNGLKNAAVAAAPVAGSYITLYFHWRGNFTTLLLLGALTLLMTITFIPKYQLPEQKETISLRSYILLFQSKPMKLLMLHIMFLFVPYWIFVGTSPLLYMKDLGVSLTHFGYYQGALALAFAVGSVSYGLMLNKFDQKKMLRLSNFLFIASTLCVIALSLINTTHPLLITFALLLFVLAQIVPSTIIYPLCLNFMPHAKGKVSGLVNASSLILQSIGLQLAGFYYAGSFRHVGFIIAFFIAMISISLFLVSKNRELMRFSHEAS